MPAAEAGRGEPAPGRLILLAWACSGAVLVVLALAVVSSLGTHVATLSGGPAMRMSLSSAFYRGGNAIGPARALLGSRLITAWQLDAPAVAVLVLAAAAYLTGVALVPVRGGGLVWPPMRTLSFLAGLAVCGFATCGSVAVYDQVLFSAHMAGHLALVMLGPALIVAGRPLTLTLTVARRRTRGRIDRVVTGRVVGLLTSPPVAFACYAAVIVGTHLTGLMNTIMRRAWAGQLEHVVFLLVGLQFFALVVGDEPIRWKLATPARWLMLALAMAVDTFTGVVLLQGTSPVAMMQARFAVDPLSDTHTGGAIMWFGGDAIMAVVMVALVIGWLKRDESSRQDADSWAERARVAAFVERTAAPGVVADPATAPDTATFDDDDAARTAYNDWLARLDRGGR